MQKGKYWGKGNLSRREFMEISGFSAGMLAVGSLINSPVIFAKEGYPRKTITFILPFAVGGGFDVYARLITPYLSKYLKESSTVPKDVGIVIKNIPTSAGRKGYFAIKNADADGYTIGMLDNGAVSFDIIDNAGIDFAKFTILQLTGFTKKLIVTSKKGFNNWDELLKEMKKRPIKMAAGSFGLSNHIVAIVANEKMGTNFKVINFPGTSGNLNALIRGDVDVAIGAEESYQVLIDAQQIRPLLVFDEISEYPGAVSIKQLGFPALAEFCSTYRFIIAPPGLGAEPKSILISALRKASNDAEFVANVKKFNMRLKYLYGDDAAKLFLKLKKDYEDMTPTLKKYLGA